ncbi:Hypothetical predicted protein, partial [Paramuricea clavata]
MAKEPALAEAARLLSQAASSLINQSSQPSTSGDKQQAGESEGCLLFATYNQANASTSRSVPLNGNIPQRRASTNHHAKALKRRKSVKEISIKFFCLASTTQRDVPNNDEKQQLLVAGLGEKKVTLQADSTSSDVVAALKETYPKLTDGGGYEFMYAKASSRQLSVIDEGENGYTIEFLKQFVGQGRVYIRPIHCDLDLKAMVKAKDQGEIIEEICNHCMNIFPLNKLREHLYLCPENNT